ncbi:MAG: Hsp20/alpha crystallin family protein [Proteobacteria bacterium]|nr:Hsp20/alpha crystallin family protein [Pseudomonadota bacterium]
MSQELQAKEKKTVEVPGELTKPGRVFVPAVDIYESEDKLVLMADMPGVEKDGLSIDLKNDTLTVRGECKKRTGEGPKVLYREYEEGDYLRQFSLSEMIDQEKISAVLKDGVLTLTLPKAAPAKPRKIEIQAG